MRTAVGSFGTKMWCAVVLGLLLTSAVSEQHKHLESNRMMEDHFTSQSSPDTALVKSGDSNIAPATASGSSDSLHIPVVQEPWKSALPLAFGRDPSIISYDVDCSGVDNGSPKCNRESGDSNGDLIPVMTNVAPSNGQANFSHAEPSGPFHGLHPSESSAALHSFGPSNVYNRTQPLHLFHPSNVHNSSQSLHLFHPSNVHNRTQSAHSFRPSHSHNAARGQRLPGASNMPQDTPDIHSPSASSFQRVAQALRKPDASTTAGQTRSLLPSVSNVFHAAEDLHIPGASIAEALFSPLISHTPHDHSYPYDVQRKVPDNNTQHSNTENVPDAGAISDHHQISDVANISKIFYTFLPVVSHALHTKNISNESSPPEMPNDSNVSYMVSPSISETRNAVGQPEASNAFHNLGKPVPEAYAFPAISDASGNPEIPDTDPTRGSSDIVVIPVGPSFPRRDDALWTPYAPRTGDANVAADDDLYIPSSIRGRGSFADNSPQIPEAPEDTEILQFGKEQNTVDTTLLQRNSSLYPTIRVERVTTFDITFPFQSLLLNFPRFFTIFFKNKTPNRANRKSIHAPVEITDKDFTNNFGSDMLTVPETLPMQGLPLFPEEPEFQTEVRPAKDAVEKIGYSSLVSMDNNNPKDDLKNKQNNLANSLAMYYLREATRGGQESDLQRLTDRLKSASRATKIVVVHEHKVKGKKRGYPSKL